MLRRRWYPAAFLAALACVSTTASAQTTISGSVLDMIDGSPIPGAYVDLRTPEGLNPFEEIDTYTDAKGRYVLAAVPAGRWRVRLIFSDGPDVERVLVTPVIDINDAPHEFDYEVNRSLDVMSPHVYPISVEQDRPAAGTTHVTVLGKVADFHTREPIDGAEVRLLRASGDTAREAAASARSGADGRFELATVPVGRYLLRISREGYATKDDVVINIGSPTDLAIRMWKSGAEPRGPGRILDHRGREMRNIGITSQTPWFGTLVGMVVDERGPAAGAAVYLLDGDGAPVKDVTPGRADPTGIFRISRVEPGTYTVRVVYGDATLDLPGVSVDLGTSELNIGL